MKKNLTFAAVILAAGMSSRMGKPKQLLKVLGKSMLEHSIAAARGAGIVSPVLVLGAFADDIVRDVKLVSKCEIIFNKDFMEGQATSLRVGVRAVTGKCEAAIFMLTDQPLIEATLITELMGQFSHYKPDILYPVYKQQRGNPVIINARLFPRLMTSSGDQGARFLFSDKSLTIRAYEVENKAVITDVDTWHDYLQVLQPPNDSSHRRE